MTPTKHCFYQRVWELEWLLARCAMDQAHWQRVIEGLRQRPLSRPEVRVSKAYDHKS